MSDNPIRLLVVVNVYRPDLGGGVLFADLCEGLAERGIDVTVKCAYSYYPEWTDKSGHNGLSIRSTKENRVTVERHGIYIPSNPNSLVQRLLYEASFYLSLRRRIPPRDSIDAILVICPLVGSVAYAAAVKRQTGAPLWLNVQDLSAQAAAAGGISGRGLVGGLLVRVQNRLFRKADFWSSISEPMVEVLQHIRGSEGTVDLIPNWLHRSLAKALVATPGDLPAEAEGPVRLLYSGNIGTKQDLIGYCNHLHSTNLDFVLQIHGEGGRAPELRKWIDIAADSRFELSGLTSEADLAQALRDSDYYLITERHGVGNSFIPSKLIPGITSGTPILAVCDANSPLGMEMLEHRLGPRVDWSNLEAGDDLLAPELLVQDTYRMWKSNTVRRSAYFARDNGIERCVEQIHRMSIEYKREK